MVAPETTSSNHAIIDIGSNGVRMIIGHLNSKGKIRREFKLRKPIRLGQDAFFNDKTISEKNISRLTRAFNCFKGQFEEHKVESVRAVATSALRQASNTQNVLDTILKETGISIDVINGNEEGRLISTAVQQTLDLTHGNSLLMDIGGGSVEFNLVKKGELKQSLSFEAGTVRMLNKVCPDDFRSTPTEKEFKKAFGPHIDALDEQLRCKKLTTFVGTGGNLERIGKLKTILFESDDARVVTLEELNQMSKAVFSRSFDERVRDLGMREDRADVILPAIATTRMVMKRFQLEELHIPRVGLRDGALVDLVSTELDASI